MSKEIVSEENRPQEEWFKQAKEQTLETLPDFVNHVMNDYLHDYGTVVHAISACAIAAANAANREEGACGGITGFQAGFVMWDFIKQWSYTNNKTGMRILDFDNLLYPQYENRFEKVITSDVWEAVQKQAKVEIEQASVSVEERGYSVSPDVLAHWQSIVEGNIPFGFTVKEM